MINKKKSNGNQLDKIRKLQIAKKKYKKKPSKRKKKILIKHN